MLRFAYPSLDSTNTQARKLAREHPRDVLLVSAVTQTAGRGRTGRTWQSPAGGAWFTWTCPTHGDPRRYTAAPLLAGLAVLEALQEVVATHVAAQGLTAGLPPLTIKWPNDVLLDDAKVAGILCEHELPSPGTAQSGNPALKPSTLLRPGPSTPLRPEGTASNPAIPWGTGHLFIGIGINANLDPAALGGDLRYPATSLQHQLGTAVDVPALIDLVAGRLTQHLAALEAHGWTPDLAREVESHLAWRGAWVALEAGTETVPGRCVGLGDEGGLVLALGDPSANTTAPSGPKGHGVTGQSHGVMGEGITARGVTNLGVNPHPSRRTFHVGEVTKLRRL